MIKNVNAATKLLRQKCFRHKVPQPIPCAVCALAKPRQPQAPPASDVSPTEVVQQLTDILTSTTTERQDKLVIAGVLDNASTEPIPAGATSGVVKSNDGDLALVVMSDGVEARFKRDGESVEAFTTLFAVGQTMKFGDTTTKRGRGRPKKWKSDAERKRVERQKAASKLQGVLRRYDLTADSVIPPGLKAKYNLSVDTYGELLTLVLKDDGIQSSILGEIIEQLKLIGVITVDRSNRKTGLDGVNRGQFLTDAPRGKGKTTSGDGVAGKASDVREGEHANLSIEVDPDYHAPGDRRVKKPDGAGPDNFEEDREFVEPDRNED